MISIVIVGGGFSGMFLANELIKRGKEQVTLIDKKEYFEVTYAIPRDLVNPEKLEFNPRKLYRDMIPHNFTLGEVKEVFEDFVQLDSGEKINFDYLIICTGSNYESCPIFKANNIKTIEERETQIREEREKLKKAERITIIGGGPAGVELAGEIKWKNEYKLVNIYHYENKLIDDFSPTASNIVKNLLHKRAVQIYLSENIIQMKKDTFKSAKTGEVLSGDIFYQCTGVKPSTSLMERCFQESFDTNENIKVDKYFRVFGTKHIFAIGDCSNIPEAKMGYFAELQANYLLKFLTKYIDNNKTCPKMKPYKTHSNMGFITLGPKKGIAQLPFGVFTNKFLMRLKQKDMFVSKTFSKFER